MLQQTQVGTVQDYYGRFLARFPDLATLAGAELDDVLGLWSGLGYYSRARNLHRCAQVIMDRLGGEFPKTAASLLTLPGIGRSTAAAIASFCFAERTAILDGNVKRVLTRVLGFDADLSKAANERALWTLAEGLLPLDRLDQNMPRYTQGLMDLGSTVCLSRKPLCESAHLPINAWRGRNAGQRPIPSRARKLKRSAESVWLLWVQNHEGAVAGEGAPPRASGRACSACQCFALRALLGWRCHRITTH